MRKKKMKMNKIVCSENYYDINYHNPPTLKIPYITNLPFYVKIVRFGYGCPITLSMGMVLLVLYANHVVRNEIANAKIIASGMVYLLFILCFCEVMDSIYCQVQKKYDDTFDEYTSYHYLRYHSYEGFFSAGLVFFIVNLAFPYTLPVSTKAKAIGLIGIISFFIIYDVMLRHYSQKRKKEYDTLNRVFSMPYSEFKKKRDSLLQRYPNLDDELTDICSSLEVVRWRTDNPKPGYSVSISPEALAVIQFIVN